MDSFNTASPQCATAATLSQVGVARAEHRREPGCFLFAPAALARLLEMPVVPYRLQRPFAIDLFLEPPQDLLD